MVKQDREWVTFMILSPERLFQDFILTSHMLNVLLDTSEKVGSVRRRLSRLSS
jgi:hypothetical protein